MFNKKEKNIHIQILLHCPDGFDESVGFDIPSQLNDMIKYVNEWSKKEGYSITLSEFNHKEFISKYKSINL